MPRPFLKIPFLISTCVITISLYGQTSNPPESRFSANDLKQDFTQLRTTMQKIHPGLYRYKSKRTVDAMFDSCLSGIRDSMTVTEFYALTRFAIASIGDGHTNTRLSNELVDNYYSRNKIFPAMVVFIHNRAFAFCCKQDSELAGSELLSINNKPLTEIIQRLFRYIQSDGFIESHKNWELPEDFQLLFNILYGAIDRYDITYRSRLGQTGHASLHADFIRNVVCASPFPKPDKYLELSYTPDHIAVLTIKSFYEDLLRQGGESFSSFLDSAFTDIKNKKTYRLLIDLRGNQGGNDENGELLYSYLAAMPFRYYSGQATVDDHYTVQKHPELAIQQPRENNFKGKLYVLVNGRSFSASAEFSSIVKTNNRGTFFGEECGGGYYGNTSGAETYLTLNHTSIIARIPMVKYSMAVRKLKPNIWGIKPDYPVYATIEDLMAKKDGQLDYAIGRIRKF